MSVTLRLCLIAFSAGLGVMVALRLGSEAMAVVVGVLMGVLSSLPVALIVLYATRRRPTQPAEEASHPWRQPAPPLASPPPQLPQMPQIVVLSAPNTPAYRNMPAYWDASAMPAPAPREFRVVGEEE